MLQALPASAWDADSLCEGWRVRDVVGHLVWRLGESNWSMLRSGAAALVGRRLSASKAIAELGREYGDWPVEELLSQLRQIAESKVGGAGRVSIVELTEAVVHAYDISEAIGGDLRLSPRSTAAVALARVRTAGPGRTLARTYTLSATDARWQIGTGPRIEATAGEILMHAFDRRRLNLQSGDASAAS